MKNTGLWWKLDEQVDRFLTTGPLMSDVTIIDF